MINTILFTVLDLKLLIQQFRISYFKRTLASDALTSGYTVEVLGKKALTQKFITSSQKSGSKFAKPGTNKLCKAYLVLLPLKAEWWKC